MQEDGVEEISKKPCASVSIQRAKPHKPKNVVMEKPAIEIIKHIRLLYIKAHVNGQSISRVLIDNGSAVNIFPLRVFRNLGKEEAVLISTEVFAIAFTGEARIFRLNWAEVGYTRITAYCRQFPSS